MHISGSFIFSKILEDLVAPEDAEFVSPIHYIYDYMSGCPDLSPTQTSDIMGGLETDSGKKQRPVPRLLVDDKPVIQQNSVALYPAPAGIPWHTTIPLLRHNKHWASAVSMARKLLTLFSEDDTANTTLRRGSKSYADIAKIELNALDRNWCLFLFYLWPAADERRLELITAAIVFVFIFDDVWEMKNEETIRIIQKEFVACLKLPDPGDVLAQDGENVTPLQEMISTIIRGFEEEDSECGNGGKDVIKWLIEFINHPPPTKEFETLREFLDYRIDDAAAQFVFACVKFSLRSSVQMDSPRIEKFMKIASDHVCYANDLGSHDKEKKAYIRGDVLYFINAVDMVKKVFHLPDDDAAKSATLVLQMQTEIELGRELERLRASSDVTVEELEYVESVVYALTGNIFCSVVMSRYGGEDTKLEI
ncbi:Terpene cyclase aneC [Psilocybe cubensis]|uniref:Terpene cyclase aneC n=2 Tax=Psilocybe cubensis TaxID=181762 RepID=A0ACB8H9P1_PSICU|nr:Terpene cyclase aneC [Psilocybe cubensis]KAH9484641.1 Terpene cyclase aneC [Psilocybe cubensis]